MQKHRTLNPVLLGRPLQVFEAISQHLALHVVEQMQKTGHRNVALFIDNAHFEPMHSTQQGQHRVCEVEISRQTVQDWMAQRYGFAPLSSDPATLELTPISATEKRIKLQLQDAISRAVVYTLPNCTGTASANQQLWQWRAELRIGAQSPEPIHILLSADQSAGLEAYVAQQRKPVRSTEPHGQPLLVDLQALLLEKTVSAADIYQLRIGSVVPIALDRALVTLNGQPMLSASVAEHQGQLHLTAFETLE